MTVALRMVLVDDEPLARMRIRSLVTQTGLPVDVVGEFGEPVTAQLWLQAQHESGQPVDVVLLDIQMPGLDGMTLAARLRGLPRPPAVVFVTAHPEHALRAFDLAAADYLTKPVRLDRLTASLQRVGQVRAALRDERPASPPEDDTVFVVQDRGRVVRVPLADILYFKAEQKLVTLHTATDVHTLTESLTELEGQVGDRFIRVHRNALVARQAMRALERRLDDEDGGEGWAVQIRPTLVWLAVSRRQVSAVREAMAQQA